MKSLFNSLLILLTFIFSSCNGFLPSPMPEQGDSLYILRFVDKDSLRWAVHNTKFKDNKGTSWANSEAFVAVMDMDYKQACSIYDSVISVTDDELERLEANIGMMYLCNRVSANMEFYDYRVNAQHSILRIEKEIELLSPFLKKKFAVLKLDYNVVSANYFAALGLSEEYSAASKEVLKEINSIDNVIMALNAGMIAGTSKDNALNERFVTLYKGILQAEIKGFKWYAGCYKLLMAMMLRDRELRDSLTSIAPQRMIRLNKDSVRMNELPQWLVEKAIVDFSDYGDRYMVIKSLAILASCYVYNNDYLNALDVASLAIEEVNKYYVDFYGDVDTLPPYELFQLEDSLELKRMVIADIVNISECMLLIRNELSCIYAALGNKEASDMNRNSYLDLLRVTRQNKEMENRIHKISHNVVVMSRWAFVIVLLLVLFVVLFVVLLRHWRIRNMEITDNLLTLSQFCRELTAFPLSREFVDKNDVDESLVSLLKTSFIFLRQKFLCVSFFYGDSKVENNDFVNDFVLEENDCDIKTSLRVVTETELSEGERMLVELLLPYISVARKDAQHLVEMGDERIRLEELNFSYLFNLIEHKKENVLKRASLSVVNGIRPYMDRMINELKILASPNDNDSVTYNERLSYLVELTDKINEYNIILERWIKMRRGEFNLIIENFALQELFDIIVKSTQAFKIKGITLVVVPTLAVIKSDKALTLFMINTLADNAAKFTPGGGIVEISAIETDEYVEVAVKDSGVGLSDEEVRTILGTKVYDATVIGADKKDVSKNKGSGFGLMNCKGIIEKHKKTDSLFAVCRMDIESTPGRGSRFSFRLPKGIMRMIFILWMFLPCSLFAGSGLGYITSLADSVYNSNVNGDYEQTLVLAQKVLNELNEYYKTVGGIGDTLLLYGSGEAAEMQWWREGFAVDTFIEDVYYNLLDVRNEVAVASLVLQNWEEYRYNNNAYTALYRLVHEDKNLETYYENMRHVVNLRYTAIILSVMLLLALVFFLLLYYFKNNVINRMNLYTTFEINKRLLKIIDGKRMDVSVLVELFATELKNSMNELLNISAVQVAFWDDVRSCLAISVSSSLIDEERIVFSIEKAFKEGRVYTSFDKFVIAFPLFCFYSDVNRCIGAIAFETKKNVSINEKLIFEMIATCVASAGYHAIIGMEREYRDFDELIEENKKIKYEENVIHVQNQVMDNCLSMIKHETLYYPSRIKELVGQLMCCKDDESCSVKISMMSELMEYYKSIYGVLTTCAANQLSNIAFTPLSLSFDEVAVDCISFVKNRTKRIGLSITLHYDNSDNCFYGDKVLVVFLMESILNELLSVRINGDLYLSSTPVKNMLLVEILDTRYHSDKETLLSLFMPSVRNIMDGDDSLSGTGYLIAKEVVRIHEDYIGLYGGRMEAIDRENGTLIRFTLPK